VCSRLRKLLDAIQKVDTEPAQAEHKQLLAEMPESNMGFLLELLEGVDRMTRSDTIASKIAESRKRLAQAEDLLASTRIAHNEAHLAEQLHVVLGCIQESRKDLDEPYYFALESEESAQVVLADDFDKIREWVMQQKGVIPLAAVLEKVNALRLYSINALGEGVYGVSKQALARVKDALADGSHGPTSRSVEWYTHNIEYLERRIAFLSAESEKLGEALLEIHDLVYSWLFMETSEMVGLPFSKKEEIATTREWAALMYANKREFRVRVREGFNLHPNLPNVANAVLCSRWLPHKDERTIEQEFNVVWHEIDDSRFALEYEEVYKKLRQE
jgi:hypothetical protein